MSPRKSAAAPRNAGTAIVCGSPATSRALAAINSQKHKAAGDMPYCAQLSHTSNFHMIIRRWTFRRYLKHACCERRGPHVEANDAAHDMQPIHRWPRTLRIRPCCWSLGSHPNHVGSDIVVATLSCIRRSASALLPPMLDLCRGPFRVGRKRPKFLARAQPPLQPDLNWTGEIVFTKDCRSGKAVLKNRIRLEEGMPPYRPRVPPLSSRLFCNF
jgi:hypothetical protein